MQAPTNYPRPLTHAELQAIPPGWRAILVRHRCHVSRDAPPPFEEYAARLLKNTPHQARQRAQTARLRRQPPKPHQSPAGPLYFTFFEPGHGPRLATGKPPLGLDMHNIAYRLANYWNSANTPLHNDATSTKIPSVAMTADAVLAKLRRRQSHAAPRITGADLRMLLDLAETRKGEPTE